MGLFDPDDFAGNPYVGGLNQMGHVIFGAFLVGVGSFFLGINIAVAISVGGVVLWELYQLRRRGGSKKDFVIDLFYWIIGIASWAILIQSVQVSPLAALAPAVPLIAWVVEFLRLSGRR